MVSQLRVPDLHRRVQMGAMGNRGRGRHFEEQFGVNLQKKQSSISSLDSSSSSSSRNGNVVIGSSCCRSSSINSVVWSIVIALVKDVRILQHIWPQNRAKGEDLNLHSLVKDFTKSRTCTANYVPLSQTEQLAHYEQPVIKIMTCM